MANKVETVEQTRIAVEKYILWMDNECHLPGSHPSEPFRRILEIRNALVSLENAYRNAIDLIRRNDYTTPADGVHLENAYLHRKNALHIKLEALESKHQQTEFSSESEQSSEDERVLKYESPMESRSGEMLKYLQIQVSKLGNSMTDLTDNHDRSLSELQKQLVELEDAQSSEFEMLRRIIRNRLAEIKSDVD